jgi:hypothetical protein
LLCIFEFASKRQCWWIRPSLHSQKIKGTIAPSDVRPHRMPGPSLLPFSHLPVNPFQVALDSVEVEGGQPA